MAVADVFKVYLYPDPLAILNDPAYEEGEDITSGIINVDIVSGSDLYEGPQQQIDTGQFTIVSRNPNLDPKINTNLKYNSAIAFIDERSGEFFRGYVTDVNVQYQRKDDPIITITGTDIFGAMRRTVVDEDLYNEIVALSSGPSWNGVTFEEFVGLESFIQLFSSRYLYVDEIGGSNTVSPGFKFFVASKEGTGGLDTNQIPITGNLGFAPAKYIPQLGENLLDIMNYYATTNLNSIYPKGEFGFFFMNVYPFVKYNGFYWPPQQDPALQFPTYQFSSYPADGRPYRSILIDNGYNNVTNQIDVSNEYRFIQSGEITSQSDNFGPYVSQQSFEDYAVSKASISTLFPDDDPATLDTLTENYATNIFQVVGFPTDEIQRIEFDNARFEDIENDYTYSNYVVNDFIRIKHQVSDTETINRFYDIAGITHSITPDDWAMSFSFKPSQQEIAFAYQGQLPTLQMNALSGDSNFNFTATIADYPTEEIDNVVWDLNQVDANDEAYYYPSAYSGEKFKNGVQRTGLTQTWNFDDDGILAAYDFETNPFGGYGPGFWWVTAYITLINGFTIAVQQGLTVGTPAVTANFGWVQNLTNNFGRVAFTNTSTNHETGEVDSYAWDFGDGTTSALQNPIKVYDPGPLDTEYEVSLTVYAFGPGGTKVYNTHTETVTLAQPTMTPNFTFIQTANTSIVTFTNTSINVGLEEPDAYFWEFDDGTTSTEKHPIHTFPASENVPITYSVSLVTRNIWEQTASVTKSVTVLSLNDAGSLPLNNIRLTVDNFDTVTPSPNAPIYPYMIFLRGRTSYTQSNLIYLAPTSRTGTTSNILWYEADGTVDETGDPYNLTRNPFITPTNQYGLSPLINNTTTQSTKWVLNTSFSDTQNIKNIQMTFRDFDGFGSGGGPQRAILNVDVPDSFGGYVNIGYFKVPAGKINPDSPYGVVSEGLKTMVARRPMPPNIPYFKYTFDNLTASFESMETANSYAWTFGDGTTSTLKNPTKTFPRRGTYNVTLAVTNGGVVTRTTTEPVIVEAIAPFDVRYVKFEQNLHDGTHAFDTPWLKNFTMKNIQDSLNVYTIYTPGPPYEELQVGKTVAKQDFYSMQYVEVDGTSPSDPTTNPYWFRLMNSNVGLRAKSLDASFLTKWNLICDFKKAWKNVADFTVDVALANISPNPTVASGISYSVYVTNHTGSTIDPSAVTWTKVGDITPTAMTQGAKTYSIVPS